MLYNSMMEQKLTKKELKELRKQEREQQEIQQVQSSVKKKWFIIGAVIFVVAAVLGVVTYKANEPEKPLPGTAVKELGRDHVTDIYDVKYTSNPPTSGSHFVLWAKRGVYDRILSDGYLIHSLEHGYIVISYNCNKEQAFQGIIPRVYAHEGEDVTDTGTSNTPLMHMDLPQDGSMGAFTPQNPPAVEVELSESFSSDSCKDLVKNLSTFLDGYDRIVIVPRLDMDTRIALTAWGRIEKFQKFDKTKMNEFITAFHNAGPEQTAE